MSTDGGSTIINTFQSTPSSRRATRHLRAAYFVGVISIHALLAEGDRLAPQALKHNADFNPRPPRGGRRRWTLTA